MLLLARILGPTDFGRFTFIYSSISYIAFLFELGVAIAAGRRLTQISDVLEQQRTVGAFLLLALPLSGLFALAVAAVSYVIDTVFGVAVGSLLGSVALLCTGILWQLFARELLQGLGATGRLIFLNLAPWTTFLVVMVGMNARGAGTLASATVVYFTANLVCATFVLVSLRPSLVGWKEHAKQVLSDTRSFGFHAFLGRVAGTGTYQMDVPLVAYFSADPAQIGFYGLAKNLILPITLISRSIGVAGFRTFAGSTRLPMRTIYWTIAITAVACFVIGIGAPVVVVAFLSAAYSPLLPLLYVWLAVALVKAGYELPLQFLIARGKGRTLRSLTFQFGAANLLLNFSLVPIWGAMGASVASLGACAFWLVRFFQFFRRSERELRQVGRSAELSNSSSAGAC